MNPLDELQRLRHIYEAIPPLPDADTLYNKILHGIVQLRITTRSMSDLFDRINSLRNSQEALRDRLLQLQLLEAVWDKTHMAFNLLRTEMRTLFAVAPLLIACEMISEYDWEAKLRKPQWDDRGKSLLLDHGQIEKVIADQFDLLDEYRLMLEELRQNLTDEENREMKSFQEMLNSSLVQIQKQIENRLGDTNLSSPTQNIEELKALLQTEVAKLKDSYDTLIDVIRDEIADAVLKITPPPLAEHAEDDSSSNTSGEGEGIDMLDQALSSASDDRRKTMNEEANVIERNAEFMENVDVEDDAESVRRAQWQRRCAIEREIQTKYADIDDMEALVMDLEWESTCEPRNFEGGVIRRKDEKSIRCVFCDRIGVHYSDSCAAYKEVDERKRILQLSGRCECCLEIKFEFHHCRKAMMPCYHCKERGHHSAICDFPERSEEIRMRINDTLEQRRATLRKIENLEEQLRQLQ